MNKSQFRLEGYQIEGPLGSGTMGDVWCCREIATNKLYAVKEMRMNDAQVRRTQLIQRSCENLEKYKCPFLVEYLGYRVGAKGEPCLVFEYLPGGDINCLLHRNVEIPRKAAVRWVREVTSALCYLHKEGLIHRDVKTSNVMLTSPDLQLASAKLSDFDTMRDVRCGMTMLIGTQSYRAPETDRQDYNEKADIWSLGCFTYILLCRNNRPFPEHSDRRTEPNYRDLDPAATDFIKRCLAYEAQNRPSAAELLKHPFLQAEDQLISTFSTILDNSIAQARLFATLSLTDGYSSASNAYRMALETMDIYRDRHVEGWEGLQGKVDELWHLTDQLFRQLS